MPRPPRRLNLGGSPFPLALLLQEPGAACARLFDGFQMSAAKRRRVATADAALPGGQEQQGAAAAPDWVPVTVAEVDEHHHVLQSDVFRTALQEASGLVLVNFDSHDDLGVPPPSPGLSSTDAAVLQAACDVGTWIVPLLAHRAVRTLVWVTAWANIPRGRFDAFVVRHPCGKLAIGGANVPPIWRSLWGDDYTADAALASKPGQPGAPVVHPFRVVVTDAKDAVRDLKCELARGDRAARASVRCALSVDIDFFSTRNPALRSLPFSDHPSFAKAIWRLARAVPIVKGDAFHAALVRLVAPGEDPHALVEAIVKVAVGTPYEARPPRHEVVSTVHAAVERFKKLSRGQREDAYGALLRAHLADHQATPAELKQLMEHFQEAAAVVMAQPGACRKAVLARSEMYTTKRQASDILLSAMDILQVLP